MLDLDGLKPSTTRSGTRPATEHIRGLADALSEQFAVGNGPTGSAATSSPDRAPRRARAGRRSSSSAAERHPARSRWRESASPQCRHRRSAAWTLDGELLSRGRHRAPGRQAHRASQPSSTTAETAGTASSTRGSGTPTPATLANALALRRRRQGPLHPQPLPDRLPALRAGRRRPRARADERVARVRLAGLLHDVGKIGVPDAILNKPGPLPTPSTRRCSRHARSAARSSRPPTSPRSRDWIRHHHERYDGTGYPDGLRGDAIPLESRIILACDAYEAMTSNRPYRKAPGRVRALRAPDGAGTQFDPGVVEAICRALASRTIDPGVPLRAHPQAA